MPLPEWLPQKEQGTPRTGEEVESLEHSWTPGGGRSGHNRFGRQLDRTCECEAPSRYMPIRDEGRVPQSYL